MKISKRIWIELILVTIMSLTFMYAQIPVCINENSLFDIVISPYIATFFLIFPGIYFYMRVIYDELKNIEGAKKE